MKEKLTYRWRKVERHLYCLHINNGKNEVATYANWRPPLRRGESGSWSLTHKNQWMGGVDGSSKLGITTKRALEGLAATRLEQFPSHWESAVQTGPGAIVWCRLTDSFKALQMETVTLHIRGLELVQIYNDDSGRSSSRWLVCRMR